MKTRLDQLLVQQGLARSRSQAENWLKLGKVTVDGRVVTKSGTFVRDDADVRLTASEQYVSRAGLKLASVAKLLGVDFRDKIVLDVGSSTGGFTDYALQHGASKVYSVDVGTEQLHPSLRGNAKIELYEKTDIREVVAAGSAVIARPSPKSLKTASRRASVEYASVEPRATDISSNLRSEAYNGKGGKSDAKVILSTTPNIIVIDVSFISLRDILPHIATRLAGKDTQIMAMLKPQFEAGRGQTNKGIIKNEAMRRTILKEFELWAKEWFVIHDKRDSDVAGARGNRERFYLLRTIQR